MSLVMAISNCNGIVISADKRLTCRTIDPNTGLATSVKYFDTEQKVFTTKSGHAIAFTGESMLSNGQFTSEAIKEVIENTGDHNLSVYDELTFIKEKLLPVAGMEDTNLLCAGIENGINKIYVTSLRSDKIQPTEHPFYCSGIINVAVNLYFAAELSIGNWSIEKVINYLKFLNAATVKNMSFCEIDKTVGADCDFVIITKTNIRFVRAHNDKKMFRNGIRFHLPKNIRN